LDANDGEDAVMNEVQEIDVERIMERIRENIRRRRSTGASERGTSTFLHGQVAADFAYLHSGYDINNVSLVSHRRLLGSLVLATKKVIRKLLAPILDRQVAYNAASTRVATHLKDWVEAQGHISDALRVEIGALEARLRAEMLAAESRFRDALADAVAAQARMGEELGAQSQELQALRQASVAARERISRTERTLRRAFHDSQIRQNQENGPESPARERTSVTLAVPEHKPEFDYSGFEERFRGSEEEIKERQRIYVSYFEGRDNVVDVGCGRGEFLELMGESGIRARGVDLDRDMILLCREKGLDVSADDAFAYLGALPDDSLGGVFAAHVIEHLPPLRVIELVNLCHRKLGPGGVLILETPNPKCLMVFADTFYKDPSHVQPAHPDTMQFLFEALNFHQVELRFLGPVDPFMRIPLLEAPGADFGRFNEGIDRLNTLLFGFQDYAVIGRKSLAPPHQDLPSSELDS
jgi:2-polyprenyl-3-methyl-5-hydroxy-6-metoxy-1,4-benzoquinol methylase